MRLLRIVRKGDRHDPHDLTIALYAGEASSSGREGPPAVIVPGQTLRSFVHDVLRTGEAVELEMLGLMLSRRVLDAGASNVRIELAERPWTRIEVAAKAQGQAFALGAPERRTAVVSTSGGTTSVASGIEGLAVMRTWGFLSRRSGVRADDGSEDAVPALFAGTLSATWTHGGADDTCPPYRHGVRAAILETFALHAARSIHDTLSAIADVILATYEDILTVTLVAREYPYRPADPLRSSLDTPDNVFVIAEEPLGVVEVTVDRAPIDN